MKPEEIQHLATLSRLEITEAEAVQYAPEIDAILGYIDQIKDITADIAENDIRIESSSVRNVMRPDAENHATGKYTESVIASAPESQDQFVKVKKILSTDN